MNLNTFEKTSQERIIEAEALGEAEASLMHHETFLIKQKIEKRKQKKARLVMIVGSLACAVFFLLILVGYSQYKLYTLSQEEKIQSAGVMASSISFTPANTGEEVVRALSRHILLPEGTPQIAEIKDVTKLRDSQAFFKDAQNGDIVVIYNTTIIIYRPSKDIIVAEGDISGVGQQKP